jgi:hypothetical protein
VRWLAAIGLMAWVAWAVAAEPTARCVSSPHCPPAPDQLRAPIGLFTQDQAPPVPGAPWHRVAPSFHPVTQSPPHFTTAPPPPCVRLMPFAPPSVRLAPFIPPCVSTFQVHTPAPRWLQAPPRPGVQIVTVSEQPPHHGPPFQRPNISLVHQPPPSTCPTPCLP